MKAQMKSGKIITGKLAQTFSKIGIAKEVKEKKEPTTDDNKPDIKKPTANKKAQGAKSKVKTTPKKKAPAAKAK